MTTWVFGGANRDKNIWPELKSRFFTIHLKEYSEADFITITRTVLISRENVASDMAELIACSSAKHTRDVREAIHLGRLAKTPSDLNDLIKLRWPERDAT